jgi:hypothetical protein
MVKTLFHNPSGGFNTDIWECVRDMMGFSAHVAKQFSQVLTQAQAAGNKTKWVASSIIPDIYERLALQDQQIAEVTNAIASGMMSLKHISLCARA